MVKAVMYLRTSSATNLGGDSEERQKDAIRKFADLQDMEIVSGNGMGLLSIDIKEQSSGNNDLLSMFRFNNQRTGYFNSSGALLLGDLNQDYVLDILDIVQLVNIVIGNQDPNSSQIWSADLNSDGLFNVLDVVLLSSIVLDRWKTLFLTIY